MALPFPLPAVPAICSWHQRYNTDPAHSWLREQVIHAFRGADLAAAALGGEN